MTEYSKLKKKLDQVFSQYIRLRDSKNGMAKCITCGVVKPIKEMHNGHYIPRNTLATRFDEYNCNAQCPSCNLFKEPKKMMLEYREALIRKHGEAKVKELEAKRHDITKLDLNWYREKIEYYQNKVKEMS